VAEVVIAARALGLEHDLDLAGVALECEHGLVALVELPYVEYAVEIGVVVEALAQDCVASERPGGGKDGGIRVGDSEALLGRKRIGTSFAIRAFPAWAGSRAIA
jgi:hypothetical protein